MQMNLQGKVALVTGGARRLGKAVVLKLAERGARVVIHYHHSVEDAIATAAEVEQLGGEAKIVQGDLSQVDQVDRVVSEAAATWGRLDILVNNAAIFFDTPLDRVTEEQWDYLFDVNLKGAFFCSQRAAAEMRRNDGGVIINFVDTGIYITWKNYTPYLISKAGVEQMTYAMAKELAPDIRVNAVALGPVLLPDGHTTAEGEKFAATTLLQRLGGSDALAEAVLYLIEADFVTGVVLPVDGGQRWYGQ
jgi:NAD(P)-dependent dehydrogenase (short-subunit alcohol dehydrogenase family)